MDLRYGIPPEIELDPLFLLNFPTQPRGVELEPRGVLNLGPPILNFGVGILLLVVMLLLLFLFTSAEVPLNLNANRIRLRVGDFSIAFTTSFVASLFFPPSLFWPVHILLVFSSPRHGMFFHLFKHFLGWFSAALRFVPAYFIIITQNGESSNLAPLQDDVELGLILEQHNSEHNE